MRHIAASLLGEQGETLTTIQDVLGHLTPAMSQHYRHILERSRRELADRWGAHVETAVKNLGDFYDETSKATKVAEIDSDADSVVLRPSTRKKPNPEKIAEEPLQNTD